MPFYFYEGVSKVIYEVQSLQLDISLEISNLDSYFDLFALKSSKRKINAGVIFVSFFWFSVDNSDQL